MTRKRRLPNGRRKANFPQKWEVARWEKLPSKEITRRYVELFCKRNWLIYDES